MIEPSWIANYHELIKLVFTLVIVSICLCIVLKTHRIFKLSYHEGIRYFRNAFLFYGLAFIARYFSSFSFEFLGIDGLYYMLTTAIFEFFIVMAGFFLFYSLLCKNFESEKPNFSSLFSLNIVILYSIALIMSILDTIWGIYHFMLLSQIIVFSFAGGIAFSRYNLNQGGQGFLRLYLMVILLNLASWILYFIVASFFGWNQWGLISIYALDLLIFLMFLYGVIKVTKK